MDHHRSDPSPNEPTHCPSHTRHLSFRGTDDSPSGGFGLKSTFFTTVLERSYHFARAQISDVLMELTAADNLVVENADEVAVAAHRYRQGGVGFSDLMILPDDTTDGALTALHFRPEAGPIARSDFTPPIKWHIHVNGTPMAAVALHNESFLIWIHCGEFVFNSGLVVRCVGPRGIWPGLSQFLSWLGAGCGVLDGTHGSPLEVFGVFQMSNNGYRARLSWPCSPVLGLVLPSSGAVSPATARSPASAPPSRSMTSSPTVSSASFCRLRAAFSLRS